jgi:hypothetical protein
MIKNTLIILHLIVTVYYVFYEFLIKNKDKYDNIYCIMVYFLILHWTLLNGECIITYWFKLVDNKKYKAGTSSTTGDFDVIFGKYKNQIAIFIFISIFLNLYLICRRKNINISYYYLFITIFTAYLYVLYSTKNTLTEKYYLINKFYTFILIIFGINFCKNYYINNNIQ